MGGGGRPAAPSFGTLVPYLWCTCAFSGAELPMHPSRLLSPSSSKRRDNVSLPRFSANSDISVLTPQTSQLWVSAGNSWAAPRAAAQFAPRKEARSNQPHGGAVGRAQGRRVGRSFRGR